jgi:hypothetical protein
MAAVIYNQAKTLNNKIHIIVWRNSFKIFLILPTNTGRNIINQIIENQELTQKRIKIHIPEDQQKTTHYTQPTTNIIKGN